MLFPIIAFTAFLMDSFMLLFIVGFVVWLLYNWTDNGDFSYETTTFMG